MSCPLCCLAALGGQDEAANIFIWGSATFLFPVLLLFPIGMAFVGVTTTIALAHRIGSFDLLRLTPVSDKDILHVFIIAAFFKVRMLLILGVLALMTGVTAFVVWNDAPVGITLYLGLLLLNPTATLVGIGAGLRIQSKQIAPIIAISAAFTVMLFIAGSIWVILAEPTYQDYSQFRPIAFSFFAITALVLIIIYQIALRLIRRPDAR